MLNRKTLRIAGAAILGTLVGTSPAYAVITLGVDNKTVTNPVVIATESLTSSSTVDGKKYYHVSATSTLNVMHQVGIMATATDTLTVTYTFENMVVVAGGLLITNASLVSSVGGATVTHRLGGNAGDNSVQFQLSGAALPTSATLTLQVPILGVAPNAAGSIRIDSSIVSGGQTFTKIQNIPDAIKTMRALQETPSAEEITALVSTNYMRFSSGTGASKAVLGTVGLGVKADFTTAADASEAVTLLTDPAGDGDIVSSGRVTFAGDISFVDKVFLDAADTCDTSGATQLVTTSNGVKSWVSGDSRPTVGTFATVQNLCIEVDGKTVIPSTGPYTATASYVGISDAAFPPTGTTLSLGSIERDGTTVHIPYLTTDDRYNQKLVIVNRNTSAVDYTIKFTHEDSAVELDDFRGCAATDCDVGMLQPGRTVLSLLNNDPAVVSIPDSAKQRTAATLEVSSEENKIDVAVVTLTRGNGSVDTVRYTRN